MKRTEAIAWLRHAHNEQALHSKQIFDIPSGVASYLLLTHPIGREPLGRVVQMFADLYNGVLKNEKGNIVKYIPEGNAPIVIHAGKNFSLLDGAMRLQGIERSGKESVQMLIAFTTKSFEQINEIIPP